MGPVTRSCSRTRSRSQSRQDRDRARVTDDSVVTSLDESEAVSKKRRRLSPFPVPTPEILRSKLHWFKRSCSGFLRAALFIAGTAIALFCVHHQLQMIYYRTCRANLIAVVLHNQSDVCHGLNLAINAIERGYQTGLITIMQGGASAAAVMIPWFLTSHDDAWWRPYFTERTGPTNMTSS